MGKLVLKILVKWTIKNSKLKKKQIKIPKILEKKAKKCAHIKKKDCINKAHYHFMHLKTLELLKNIQNIVYTSIL